MKLVSKGFYAIPLITLSVLFSSLAMAAPVSEKQIEKETRAILKEGRAMKRNDLYACGDQMRQLIARADKNRTQGEVLFKGNTTMKGILLGEATTRARQCVTCSPSAVEYCDLGDSALKEYRRNK
ncbi:hypothetical protein R6242_20285 [Iodobacter sp. CM08]|uniref:hypothetical protein n=1 Tax=Iodobacter sp. CM08 TaxID=3085902 RepID=UPI002980FD84|nr:hypothetical protein [Iodobacter sp. CM08]MDW5418914.1 hypothetical protein [Iodobacter sp. CM08]